MRRASLLPIGPYLIALFIMVLIFLLAPLRFSRYALILDDQGFVDKEHGKLSCADLNGDGTSEILIEFSNSRGNLAFKAFHGDWGNIDQWNFEGKRTGQGQSVFACELGNDSLTEIAAFYHRQDSIFLSVIQPWPSNRQIAGERFITTVRVSNDTIDYNISDLKVAEITGDDSADLVFSIVAGFSKDPRAVFVYDISADTVIRSESYGFAINGLLLYDLDKDGREEIIAATTARGNIPATSGIPYPDYQSYVVAYDDDLDLLFQPLAFDYFPSSSRVWIEKESEEGPVIAVAFLPNSGVEEFILFFKLDPLGEILQADSVFIGPMPGRVNVIKANYKGIGHYFITGRQGATMILDEELNLLESLSGRPEKIFTWICADIDLDGDDEHIALAGIKSDLLIVSDFWLNDPAEFKLEAERILPDRTGFHVRRNKDGDPQLLVQRGDLWYLFRYHDRPYYYLNYFIYLGIYLAVLIFIIFILRIQKDQLEKKYETERKLAELQLMTIKGQIDPHFTFNAMNSIGAVIFKEDRKTAYSYFTKFSKLIRLALESSDRLSRSLEEEMDFVKLYLELEKFRFKNKFSYALTIGDSVNLSMHVPRMIVQTFVENAIKHGLMSKEEGGFLSVELWEEDELRIRIRDNGIGLARAASLEGRTTGRGLKIIDQIIGLYEKVNQKKISYTLQEIRGEDGRPAGTEVLITIPLS